MLALGEFLPSGGQRYVDAAANALLEQAVQLEQVQRATQVATALLCSLRLSITSNADPSCAAPALSAAASTAAIRMVVQLQLLAAGLLQQQWQQGQATALGAAALMSTCSCLLELQIKAVLQASGSNSLPLELLQQAGLQLLQALAAPVQQLQLLLWWQQQQQGKIEEQASVVAKLVDMLQSSSDLNSANDQVLYTLGAACGLSALDTAQGEQMECRTLQLTAVAYV
jgi:hypothetical protein